MHRFLTVVALLLMVSSCARISSLIHDDQVIAKVGDEKLYKSDLEFVMPEFLSPDDSATFAQKYIKSWAMERLYTRVAENELSSKEKNVTAELGDYRRSLLKFRYEQRYVADRLDTLVTDTQVKRYYDSHTGMYELERPILKFRYVDILRNVPEASQIIRKMKSDRLEDNDEAAALADSLAIKYIDRTDQWVDAMVLAKEFGMDYSEMLRMIDGRSINLDTEDRLDVKYAWLCDIRRFGTAPIEFCSDGIRETIVSVRKHELLKGLEQDLLDDALDRNLLVIYEHEDN